MSHALSETPKTGLSHFNPFLTLPFYLLRFYRETTALYWAIFNSREKTLKLLLEAGVKLTKTDLTRYPKNIKVMRNPDLKQMLQNYVSQPPSLQQCCRLGIRKQLVKVHADCSIMNSLMSLPVPQKMKDFIALRTVLQ